MHRSALSTLLLYFMVQIKSKDTIIIGIQCIICQTNRALTDTRDINLLSFLADFQKIICTYCINLNLELMDDWLNKNSARCAHIPLNVALVTNGFIFIMHMFVYFRKMKNVCVHAILHCKHIYHQYLPEIMRFCK